MAIFLTKDSKVIVQGMTGSEGMKHTKRMLASGAKIVGGVNPRKACEKVEVDGQLIPVFGTVAEAIAETGANVSVIFVPPAFAKSAVIEAIVVRVISGDLGRVAAGLVSQTLTAPFACLLGPVGFFVLWPSVRRPPLPAGAAYQE